MTPVKERPLAAPVSRHTAPQGTAEAPHPRPLRAAGPPPASAGSSSSCPGLLRVGRGGKGTSPSLPLITEPPPCRVPPATRSRRARRQDPAAPPAATALPAPWRGVPRLPDDETPHRRQEPGPPPAVREARCGAVRARSVIRTLLRAKSGQRRGRAVPPRRRLRGQLVCDPVVGPQCPRHDGTCSAGRGGGAV